MTRRVHFAVWAVMVLATFASWFLGHTEEGSVGNVCVIAVAAIKMRLIGLYFMEIKGAPTILRGVFDAYVTLLSLTIALFYVLG